MKLENLTLGIYLIFENTLTFMETGKTLRSKAASFNLPMALVLCIDAV